MAGLQNDEKFKGKYDIMHHYLLTLYQIDVERIIMGTPISR